MGTTCYYPLTNDDADIYNSGCKLKYYGAHGFANGVYVGGSIHIYGFELKATKDFSIECTVQFTGKNLDKTSNQLLMLSRMDPDNKASNANDEEVIFLQRATGHIYQKPHGYVTVDPNPVGTTQRKLRIECRNKMLTQYIDDYKVFGYMLTGAEVFKHLAIGRCLDANDPEIRVSGIRITNLTKVTVTPPAPPKPVVLQSYFPYAVNLDDTYHTGLKITYDGAHAVSGGWYTGTGIHISNFELKAKSNFTIEFTFQFVSGMAGDWSSLFVLAGGGDPAGSTYVNGDTMAFMAASSYQPSNVYENSKRDWYVQNPGGSFGCVNVVKNSGSTQVWTCKLENRMGAVTAYVNGQLWYSFKLKGDEAYKFMRFGRSGFWCNPTFKLKNFRVVGYSKIGPASAPVPAPTNCKQTIVKNKAIRQTTLKGIERNNTIRSAAYNTLAQALEDLGEYGKHVDNCGNCVFECTMTCQTCQKCQGCQR